MMTLGGVQGPSYQPRTLSSSMVQGVGRARVGSLPAVLKGAGFDLVQRVVVLF